MADGNSVVPVEGNTTPAAGKDPIANMVAIAENANLTDQDKTALIRFATNRFTNRRRMAYIALFALVGSLVLIFTAAFIDGYATTPVTVTVDGTKVVKEYVGILKSIQSSQTLFTCLVGFFTAIVGAYYGVSAWRPSS